MEFRLELRPARIDDIERHYSIYRASMRDYEVAAHGDWDETTRWEDFRRHFPVPRARIILVNGEPVGSIDVERRADVWWLNNVEIHPAWQSKGIGTVLITELLENAHAEGLPAALEVLKVNPRARTLYERLGFAVIGESTTHLQMRALPGIRD